MMTREYEMAFDHVEKEIKKHELESSGSIPKWINGCFYRNGPGLLKTSNASFKHWFDGLAIIHQFDIKEGKVYYQSKYIDGNVKKELKDNDRISYPEFATDPCYGIFQKLRSWFEIENPKVNIMSVNDKIIALGETSIQLEIDKENLQSLGIHTYLDTKMIPALPTAHPYKDGNSLYNLVVRMGPLNFYQIVKYNVENKETQTIAKIPVANPSYVHSMGMSENYFIVAHYPFQSNSIEFLLKKRPYIENFTWRKSQKTKLFIIHKKTGKVVKQLKTKPFFAFHFINAFEKDDKLIFDMNIYDNADIIDAYYLNKLSSPTAKLPKAKVHRFSYDFKEENLDIKKYNEINTELATIDELYQGSDYQYIYGASLSDNGQQKFYDQLVKLNVKTGESLIWRDENYYPGEPIFIPKPNAQSDDDGVIISILINVKNETEASKLLFLDAASFTEIASCFTNNNMIPGFHGCFINS